MSARVPLQIRIHGWLLRLLQPTLGSDFVLEANATFAELFLESRSASFARRARLWSREVKSLTATLLSELRRGSSDDGPRQTARARGSQPGPGARTPRVSTTLENLVRDLGYAVRGLFRAPLFATVAVSSLALGVAATTAIFSVVNASWLRDAPYVSRPDQLVRIFGRFPDDLPYGPLAYADIADIGQQASTLQDVAAYSTETLTLSDDANSSRQIQAEAVSENWFTLLGVPLALGRGFLAEDIEAGTLVTVIGYRMWERDFARDPAVLGKSVRLDGRSHTVIGVAPVGMLAHEEPFAPELWVLVPEFERKERGYIGLKSVARLREGVTIAQVQGEVDLIAQRLAEQFPDSWTIHNGERRGLAVLSDRAGRIPPGQRAQVAATLGALVAVVTLVLLIACSNVANLLLTRAWRRRTEIAVRLALGAGRGRLIGQLLGESIVLALLSGGLALLLIHWIASALRAGGLLVQLPAPIDLSVDWRVAAFALGLSLATGVVFGLVPALQASNPSLVPTLKGLESGGRQRRFSTRNLLVVAQVAASLVLVFSAALLLRCLEHARAVDIGFDPSGVAIVTLDVSHGQYDEAEASRFYHDLLDRLRGLPGVEGAALASRVPLEGGRTRLGGIEPEGYDLGPTGYLAVDYNTVSPGYFDLIRMPVLQGRDFEPADRAGEGRVAIVNQTFAERYWPGQNPIGKRIKAREDFEVVGVVRDAKYVAVTDGPTPHMWAPAAQSAATDYRVHVRSSDDPRRLLPLIREQVHALDPDLPIAGSTTMKSLTDRAVLPYRIASAVLSSAGAVALALAMIGIYGVIAFAVSQRTREVGIRVAVGAGLRSVVGMIVREGLALTAVGAAVALPLILLLTQLLKTFVIGVRPLDPVSLLAGMSLLALSAAAASLVPALRAARVDPIDALRAE